MRQYGIRYGDRVVEDSSWRCVADVMASYHGSGYTDPHRRVTGELVVRESTAETWEAP